MQKVTYPLLQQQLTINTTFFAKQFIIKNSSQFPIYINTSGGYPTSTSFEFSVQPNCDFSSSEINTKTLFIFSNANVFTNYAVIDVYDEKRTEPNNTPYLSNQSVPNVAGYPVNVSGVLVNGLYQYTLPSIKFDNFNPLYFLIAGANGGLSGTPFILTESFFNTVIGGCHGAGIDGLIYYSPSVLNTAIPFTMYSKNSGIANVSLVNSPNLLFKRSYHNAGGTLQTPIGVALNSYSVIEPPAFYSNMIVYNNTGALVNYNFSVTVTLTNFLNNAYNIINFKNYVGSVNANSSIILEPDFFNISSEYRLLNVNILNNIVLTSALSVAYNIFNY